MWIVTVHMEHDYAIPIGPFRTKESALIEVARLAEEIEEDNKDNRDELPEVSFSLLRQPGIPWADLT